MTHLTHYEPELLWHDGRFQAGLRFTVDGEGRLVEVGASASDSEPGRPGTPAASSQLVPLPGRAVLPGCVNAHSHAFQRLIRGRTEYVAQGRESDDFWSWRELMYRAAERLSPDDLFIVSRQAFLEMARSGITTVGEFHYLHHGADGRPYDDKEVLAHAVIRAAREVGVRICLLRVGYARAGHQVPENPRQRRFIDPSVDAFLASVERLAHAYADSTDVSVGLAPHSVRAVPREWLESIGKARGATATATPSGLGRLPLHMHVSEQTGEIAASLKEHGRRPVQLLSELGLLDERFTAVHGIHLEPDEVGALGQARAFVCACPSTERNLGDGIIPADLLLGAGARLCLGSDSQVSIDLLDEARQLEGHLRLQHRRRAVLDPGGGQPDGLASRLLGFASHEGAASLGLDSGRLEAGRPADFFTVDLSHPSLLGTDAGSLLPALLLGGAPGAIEDVYVGGKRRVAEGRHPLEEPSGEAFRALARRVFG